MKFQTLGIVSLLAISLSGCGQAKHSVAVHSSSKPDTNNPNSVLSGEKTNSSSESSSDVQSSASNSNANFEKMSAPQIGTMLWLKTNTSFLKQQANGFTVKSNYQTGQFKQPGYTAMFAGGDVSSILFYKTLGNAVTYYTWSYFKKPRAHQTGTYVRHLTSVENLVNQYYNNAKQKTIVDNVASNIHK